MNSVLGAARGLAWAGCAGMIDKGSPQSAAARIKVVNLAITPAGAINTFGREKIFVFMGYPPFTFISGRRTAQPIANNLYCIPGKGLF
jgi:hypothetical protein